MKSFTRYLTFNTPERRGLVNITSELENHLDESGIKEGFLLVSAMHITAGIWVNDEEEGLKQDFMDWAEKLAPLADYRHHRTGEDNGDAHLKRTLVHHQAMLP